MTRQDPNLAKVELIAAALGPLCDQLVFVGGCAVGLLLDGRLGLLDEVANAPPEVRTYLRTRFTELLATPNFMGVLPGMVFPDESLAERTQLVAARIRLLAEQPDI